MKYKLIQRGLPGNPQTDKKWYASLVSSGRSDMERIVKTIVDRSALTRAEVDGVLDSLSDIFVDLLSQGPVSLKGIGSFHLNAHSEGTENYADFNRRHITRLSVQYLPDVQLKKSIAGISLEWNGQLGSEGGGSSSSFAIESVYDATTGTVNDKLTRGGGVKLSGRHIRIEGADPAVGIKLTAENGSPVVSIPATAVLQNQPGEVIFIVPATMAQGRFRLSLATQYSGEKEPLNAPHTAVFETLLTVV